MTGERTQAKGAAVTNECLWSADSPHPKRNGLCPLAYP